MIESGARGGGRSGHTAIAARAAALLAVAVLALAAIAIQPAVAQDPEGSVGPGPQLDARAWILIDADDGTELAGRNADSPVPIASATKLMTAYVALDRLPLDRLIAAPAYDADPAESVLGLEQGERISVRDLLLALLIPSANDAAVTLAHASSGSVQRFVRAMNISARRLGLERTEFSNPIGLDDPANRSSARDLATLTLELREDQRFRRIVARPRARLRSGTRTRQVETRNTLLLEADHVDGVKTGHTLGAGHVLVASAERQGVELISVVLGAPSETARDGFSRTLLGHGFSLYERRSAFGRGEVLAEVPVEGSTEELALVASRAAGAPPIRADQELEVEVDVPASVSGPLERGEPVGTAAVAISGTPVAEVRLLAGRAVAAPSGGPGALPVVLVAFGSGVILIGVLIARRRAPTRTVEERMRSRGRRRRSRKEGQSGE